MKQFNNKFLIAVFVLMAISIVSCTKDDDNAPGTGEDDRTKFNGTWLCSETLIGGPTTAFTIKISSFGESDTVYIKNFNQLGNSDSALALINGSSMVIPFQSITQVAIKGSGIYTSQGKINMNYTADSDSLTAICSK